MNLVDLILHVRIEEYNYQHNKKQLNPLTSILWEEYVKHQHSKHAKKINNNKNNKFEPGLGKNFKKKQKRESFHVYEIQLKLKTTRWEN